MTSLNEQFDNSLSGYTDNTGYSTDHIDIRTATVYATSNLPFKKVPIHQLNKLVVGQSLTLPDMHKQMLDLQFAYRKQYENWSGAVTQTTTNRAGTNPELLFVVDSGEQDIDSWIEPSVFTIEDFSGDSIDISGFSENAEMFIVITAPLWLIGLFTDSNPYGSDQWATGVEYTAGTVILLGDDPYLCTTTHTSGTFATDLSAGKWTGLPAFAPSWMSITDEAHDADEIDWDTAKMPFASNDVTYNILGRIGEDIRVEMSFPKSFWGDVNIVKTVRLHVYSPIDGIAFTVSRIGIREPDQSSNMDVNTRQTVLERAFAQDALFLGDLPVWPENFDSFKIWSDSDNEAIKVISGSLVANFNSGWLPGGEPSALSMTTGRTKVEFDADPVEISGYDFTIECWIRPSDDSITLPMGIVSKYTESGWDPVASEYDDVYGAYRLGVVNQEIIFQIGENSWITDGANLVQDVWHHIAVTQNSSALYFYANGEQVGVELPVEIPEDPSEFKLGAWS